MLKGRRFGILVYMVIIALPCEIITGDSISGHVAPAPPPSHGQTLGV